MNRRAGPPEGAVSRKQEWRKPSPVASASARSSVDIAEVAPMPNLIEVQKSSYDHFLQDETP